MMIGRSRSTEWTVYTSLEIIRVAVGALLPGYVHPDEFFQGGQDLFFGCSPFVPWEFERNNALRSIFPPTVMTWFPLNLYASLVKKGGGRVIDQLSGLEVLVLPRIFCGILSLIMIQVPLYFLTRTSTTTRPTPAMWLLSTSWPTFIFLNRPFTNGLETMWLAVVLQVVKNTVASPTLYHIRMFTLGILFAVAIFTRFTFVFFGSPTLLLIILRTSFTTWNLIRTGGLCLAGFMIASLALVSADTIYYGGEYKDWCSFVAPVNALRYNSNAENLQQHGLHPRWTHILVNMFLMFGPMAFVFYTKVSCLLSESFTESMMKTDVIRFMEKVCFWCIVSGLVFLSLAPHQEPRFLAPLLVPLLVLTSNSLWNSRYLRVLWIFFNLSLLLTYGVLHQGGVFPALMTKVLNDDNKPVSFLFFHTYMPPSFATRQFCNFDETKGVCLSTSCPDIPLHDLKGSSPDELEQILELQLGCDQSRNSHLLLVSPPLSFKGEKDISPSQCNVGESFQCNPLWTHWPHLTTEDMPEVTSIPSFILDFQLTMYNVTCKS